MVGHVDHIVPAAFRAQQDEDSFSDFAGGNPMDRVVLVEVHDVGVVLLFVLHEDKVGALELEHDGIDLAFV